MIKKWTEYIKESFDKLSYTEDDIYDYTLDLLSDKVDDLFTDIHQEFDTISGDITTGQSSELNEIQEKLARLISKQVYQNLGKDFKKIKSNIDLETLKGLSDERDSIEEGDEIIAVYFDGGYAIYKLKIIDDNGNLGGEDSDNTWYNMEDAYLVVKVDTYNDFVGGDYQL